MKICNKCGVLKPLEDFYISRAMKDGRTTYCKKCIKGNYAVNKQTERERQNRAHFERQKLLAIIKDKPCKDCNVKYPPYVMQYDHLGEKEKLFVISRGIYGNLARLLEEMAKCDLVCANCHAIRTWKRAQQCLGMD